MRKSTGAKENGDDKEEGVGESPRSLKDPLDSQGAGLMPCLFTKHVQTKVTP